MLRVQEVSLPSAEFTPTPVERATGCICTHTVHCEYVEIKRTYSAVDLEVAHYIMNTHAEKGLTTTYIQVNLLKLILV
jgi:hypothetical protein